MHTRILKRFCRGGELQHIQSFAKHFFGSPGCYHTCRYSILTPSTGTAGGVHQEKWLFSRSTIRLNFVFSTSTKAGTLSVHCRLGTRTVLPNGQTSWVPLGSPKILPEKSFQKLDGIMELYEEPAVRKFAFFIYCITDVF